MVKYETSDIVEMCIKQYSIARDYLFVEPDYTNGFMFSFMTTIKTMRHAKFVEVVSAWLPMRSCM